MIYDPKSTLFNWKLPSDGSESTILLSVTINEFLSVYGFGVNISVAFPICSDDPTLTFFTVSDRVSEVGLILWSSSIPSPLAQFLWNL